MLRQRIRTRASSLGAIGKALVAAVAIALVWYGLMLVLLALKVDPGFVDSISGYRTAFDYLAGLTPADIDSTTRLITAVAGVVAFLVFGYLALRALPRPYLARHDLTLEDGELGEVLVEARAIERVAEVAAHRHPAVMSAQARAGTERIELDISLNRAREVSSDLREVRDRARAALETHGLTTCPVDVTLTGFDRKQRRELV